jgi:hypothetical protein
MQRVKEASKKAKSFLEQSQKQVDNDIDIAHIIELRDLYAETRTIGEKSITELMSDDVSPYISNQ